MNFFLYKAACLRYFVIVTKNWLIQLGFKPVSTWLFLLFKVARGRFLEEWDASRAKASIGCVWVEERLAMTGTNKKKHVDVAELG